MEIKSKDMVAFDALYDGIAEKVYRVALYYSEDHHAAEDIIQIVFMKWYTEMDNVSTESMEAWMKSTAKHMAMNYKRHKNFEVSVEEDDLILMIDSREYEEGVEEIMERRYHREMKIGQIQEIYDALYEKNSRWYEACMLVFLLEKPQDEVAEVMGMSIGSLRVMLYRAKNWVRKKYQKQLDHLDEE